MSNVWISWKGGWTLMIGGGADVGHMSAHETDLEPSVVQPDDKEIKPHDLAYKG